MMPAVDIVDEPVEHVAPACGSRSTGAGDTGGSRPSKRSPVSRQLGRDHRRVRDGTSWRDMARDQPDDPFDLGGAEPLAVYRRVRRQAVDPEPAVGIDHHLDHRRIGERRGDRRPHGGAQHGPLAVERWRGSNRSDIAAFPLSAA